MGYPWIPGRPGWLDGQMVRMGDAGMPGMPWDAWDARDARMPGMPGMPAGIPHTVVPAYGAWWVQNLWPKSAPIK